MNTPVQSASLKQPVKVGPGVTPTASPTDRDFILEWDQECNHLLVTHRKTNASCRIPMGNVLSFVEAPKPEKKDTPAKK